MSREATAASGPLPGSGNDTDAMPSWIPAKPSQESTSDVAAAVAVLCRNVSALDSAELVATTAEPTTESSLTTAKGKGAHFGDLGAFCYIIIVLSFYAISIVLLMIKYIRREQEETWLDYYYAEYVKRTWFRRPEVQNRMAMKREQKWIHKVLRGEGAAVAGRFSKNAKGGGCSGGGGGAGGDGFCGGGGGGGCAVPGKIIVGPVIDGGGCGGGGEGCCGVGGGGGCAVPGKIIVGPVIDGGGGGGGGGGDGGGDGDVVQWKSTASADGDVAALGGGGGEGVGACNLGRACRVTDL